MPTAEERNKPKKRELSLHFKLQSWPCTLHQYLCSMVCTVFSFVLRKSSNKFNHTIGTFTANSSWHFLLLYRIARCQLWQTTILTTKNQIISFIKQNLVIKAKGQLLVEGETISDCKVSQFQRFFVFKEFFIILGVTTNKTARFTDTPSTF